MSVKYFNHNNDDFIGSNKNLIYENDLTRVLSETDDRRKVADVTFTNEMAMTNMNNIETSPMEFQVGGFNPMVTTQFNTKLFDTEKEDLAIQINDINIDEPIKYDNIITNIRDKMHFLDDGGTDCICVYLQTGTRSDFGGNMFMGFISTDHNNHNFDWGRYPQDVYIVPILTNKHQFNLLMQAMSSTLIKTQTGLDQESKENFTNGQPISKILSIRTVWKTLIDESFPGASVMPTSGTSAQYNVIMIDFFNKLSVEGAELFRNRTTPFNLSSHIVNVDIRNAPDIYQNKTQNGGLPQNELGGFFSDVCHCSEGIFAPFLIEKGTRDFNSNVNYYLNLKRSICAFLTTHYPGKDNASSTYTNNNTTDPTLRNYFPQNCNPIVKASSNWWFMNINENIPQHLNSNNTMGLRIVKQGLCRLYPFLWIAREDNYHLGSTEMIHIWNNRSISLNQIIKIYGYYAVDGHESHSKEIPIDFNNLFGECSVVIPQAKSLIHNMRKQTISAVLKFDSLVNFTGERYYIPRLITPSIINIWDKTTSLLSPLKILILSQKFGSTPPFKPGSKLNMIVSLYSYYKK